MCNLCLNTGLSRRTMFGAGLAMAAAPLLASCAQAQPAPPSRLAETPDAAIQLLVEGNTRYVSGTMNQRDFSANRAARAQGQAPFASILGCADSRVAPELAFDQSPGDIFVVRIAGNFVTTEGLGSLEFGSAVLGSKVIMVLGHTSCGAVNATVDALQKGNNLPGHIADLVRAMKPGIAPVLQQPGPDLYQRAVVANVQANVKTLLESQPILAGFVSAGKLKVIGGVYDLPTGKVTLV
jgi:carbonic anhydrase